MLSPYSENEVTIYWQEEQLYLLKIHTCWGFSHGHNHKFHFNSSLPLWIYLQFLKTSWKEVIFCHLELRTVKKKTNFRKLC